MLSWAGLLPPPRGGRGRGAPNCASVASMAGGQAIVRTALDAFGRVDIVVNNAGILRDRMIFNMSEEEWDAVVDTHLKGRLRGGAPPAPPRACLSRTRGGGGGPPSPPPPEGAPGPPPPPGGGPPAKRPLRWVS